MPNKTASSSRLCLCAPTTHPGSFRCSLHRRPSNSSHKTPQPLPPPHGSQSKAATTTTDHYFLKAFLMQIVKPSSHGLQRRGNFQPKPSRFCNIVSAPDPRLAVSWSWIAYVCIHMWFMVFEILYRSFLFLRMEFSVCCVQGNVKLKTWLSVSDLCFEINLWNC